MTVNKANKALGSIKRSAQAMLTQTAFFMLYNSSVWPILKYVVPVWCCYAIPGETYSKRPTLS